MVQKTHPVVLRFKSMFPNSIRGFEMHLERAGGDLGHVDASKSHLNQRLIGSENWAREVSAEIAEMRLHNHNLDLETLKKRRRTAQHKRRIAEGPADPWRKTAEGPLREVILTANAEWFKQPMERYFVEIGVTREDAFAHIATEWLKKTFGDDCVHAHADLDETAFHIHAIIVPRTVIQRKEGVRRMLQPSIYDELRDYRLAQDSVGAFFQEKGLGLTRGERRKEALFKAVKANEEVREKMKTGAATEADLVPLPERRRHVSCKKWREQEERRIADLRTEVTADRKRVEKRETVAQRKSDDADEIIAFAASMADADSPDDVTNLHSQSGKPSKGKSVLKRAYDRLLKLARRDARRELEGYYKQIEKAGNALAAILPGLPVNARQALSQHVRAFAAAKSYLDRNDSAMERQPDPRHRKDRDR